jgi:hypothetical protein
VLPSVVAAVLSSGVVTKNKLGLPDAVWLIAGDNNRIDAFCNAVVVATDNVEVEAEMLKGKGIVCIVWKEREERICRTVVGMNVG